MYVEKSTKTIYQDRQHYTAPDGTQYPRNYPKDEIPELVKVKETPRPEGKVVSGFTVNDKFEQVWNARDKTAEELRDEEKQDALAALKQSDIEDVPRIAEDIWSLLVAKGIATNADLPAEAQVKLQKRASIRAKLKGEKS